MSLWIARAAHDGFVLDQRLGGFGQLVVQGHHRITIGVKVKTANLQFDHIGIVGKSNRKPFQVRLGTLGTSLIQI